MNLLSSSISAYAPPSTKVEVMDRRHSGAPSERTSSYRRASYNTQNRQSGDYPAYSISTQSPFQSPTSSTFAPTAGLAPRPPSFPYRVPKIGNALGERTSDIGYHNNNKKGRAVVDKPLPPIPSESTEELRPLPGQILPTVSTAKGFRNGVQKASGAVHDGRDVRQIPQESGLGDESPGSEPSASKPDSKSYSRRPSVATSSVGNLRAWASDRSPLQQLELTLNGISKEEKRARVQEAEIRLTQSKSGNNGNHPRRSSNTGQSSAMRTTSVRNSNLLQGFSSQKKVHQPDAANSYPTATYSLNTHSRPLDYDPDIPHAQHMNSVFNKVGPQTRDIESDSEFRTGDGRTGQAFKYDQSLSRSDKPKYYKAHVTDDEGNANVRAPQYLSDHVSYLRNGDRQVEPSAAWNEPIRPSQRKNSVHQTESSNMMIAEATGLDGHVSEQANDVQQDLQGPDASIRRSNSKRKRFLSLLSIKSNRPQTAQPRSPEPMGDEPVNPNELDVPLSHPPRLDEWKYAGVAFLKAADLSLEAPKPDSDQTWWERSGRKSRRRSNTRTSRFDGPDTSGGNIFIDGKDPSSFQPPLYLKCGPLLRYTGIRRERTSNQSYPASFPSEASEKEIWRGTVLIVTQDALSSYDEAPVLRLFSEPVELLPPPPAQIDGQVGEQLAPEYVDPIAGLPKVTPTGGVVYVRPVEHLDEGKDLSKPGSDEGLFEKVPSPSFISSTSIHGGVARRSEPSEREGNMKGQRHSGELVGRYKEVKGFRLNSERGCTFWRFNIEVELVERSVRIAYRINRGPSIGFWVPAKKQTMNIMFHSCNGFSLSVDSDQLSGPDPLWRDVLNSHQTQPFHVMIGGGDQIYNDALVQETSLFKEWLQLKNPVHKHSAPFTPEMRNELEQFYLDRYSMWFSQGFFGMANSQIPMVNIWDDHDIIDGYGSYPHHFMRSSVFRGLGAVAFKYYMLFQHHSIIDEGEESEPSWVLGAAPGPYIHELSRSVFLSLGSKVAFLGLDCRTERMRDEILSEETYERILNRCRTEIIKGETRHLIVLLGVPIAYPRLVWLEQLLTSRLLYPVKAAGRYGLLGGFLNSIDGGVEILDDLDDHWTAKEHKKERNWLIQQLQELAASCSTRITILGGDVHLAAIGQFYSNPKLGVPKHKDHRYMPNIISSAIVNTPPPEVLADVLNRRNKIHHLDSHTDEDMIPIFTHDVDGKPRSNKRLLPRRNWCTIKEYQPGATPPPTPPTYEQSPMVDSSHDQDRPRRTLSLSHRDIIPSGLIRRLSRSGRRNNPERPVSAGAMPAPAHDDGSYFPPQPQLLQRSSTVSGPVNKLDERPGMFHRRPTITGGKLTKRGKANNAYVDLEGGLDIVLNCEVSPQDPAGITTPYRLLVPALHVAQPEQSIDGSEGSNHRRAYGEIYGFGGHPAYPSYQE